MGEGACACGWALLAPVLRNSSLRGQKSDCARVVRGLGVGVCTLSLAAACPQQPVRSSLSAAVTRRVGQPTGELAGPAPQFVAPPCPHCLLRGYLQSLHRSPIDQLACYVCSFHWSSKPHKRPPLPAAARRRDVQARVFGLIGLSAEEARAKFGYLLDSFEVRCHVGHVHVPREWRLCTRATYCVTQHARARAARPAPGS